MTSIDVGYERLATEPEPEPGPPAPAGGSVAGRFLDAFLQPQNIKWLLVAGVLILLASSLMLVAAHWDDYAPAWKYLVLLGYTAGTWLAGRWCHGRLGLPRTGAVVMALTVLLLPVTFLGLTLVGRTGPPGVLWVGLFALNLAVAAAAARGVFRHFLRGDQPTFLACYLLLSAAGAFAATRYSFLGAAIASLALWATFAVGAVKANRHVFWLVEDRRLPRVFGFFPVLLLGLQFIVLFALGPARELPVQWMGLGCAMVAAVVLLTADAVARVFQQRTGDLVRPLPWAIVGPLVLGLALCAAGLAIAGTGIVPPGRPYAVVPTAAVVAALLALVARRTGKSAFVWAALIVATLAYNFAPVFFADLARAAVAGGASAVREGRLPIAFYGLTYLPLLAGLMALGVAARRRGWDAVVGPARAYGFGLACVLLVASLTHPKAIFPVAAAMTVVLAAQAVAFRHRLPGVAAIVAFVVAAAGLPGFARGVLGIDVPLPAGECLSLAVASVALLAAGGRVDRRLATQASRYTSLVVAAGLAVVWAQTGINPAPTPYAGLIGVAAATLLLAHSLFWLRVELSIVAICFAQVVGLRWLIGTGVDAGHIVAVVTGTLLAQWVAADLLARRPALRISRAWAAAARDTSAVELIVLLVGLYLPTLWTVALGGGSLLPATSWTCVAVAPLVVAWGFDAARRSAGLALAVLSCIAALGAAGAGLVLLTGSTGLLLPTLAGASVIGVFLAARLATRGEGARVIAVATTGVSVTVLALAATASLFVYGLQAQVAGIVAAAGLGVAVMLGRLPKNLGTGLVALVNWQVLAAIVAFAGPESVRSVLDVDAAHLLAVSLYVAAAAAASLLAWQAMAGRADPLAGGQQRAVLRVVAVVTVAISLFRSACPPVDVLLAGVTFAALAASELWAACKTQAASRAWLALATVAAALGYFAHAGVIPFGSGLSLYAPLAAAVVLQGLARLATRRPTTAVLAGPLGQAAVALPMVTVVLAIGRHLSTAAGWHGFGSLALFLAAGFYFWHGVERRERRWHVAAAAIVNLALALLWRDLNLTDPQFYMVPVGASVLAMVQLLRREIPARFHDPLRYAGALTILVSPAFHIVGGSWLHLATLMVLSVAVMLAAIGLRVRAMLYAGAAFLAADLVAMVVRGSIDNPSLLWVVGLAVGAGVVTLGALAERHRELLLQRVRVLSARLATWQ